MSYALADIVLFILLLVLLWLALFYAYLWFVRRRQRAESQQIIQLLEKRLNEPKNRNRKEDSDA